MPGGAVGRAGRGITRAGGAVPLCGQPNDSDSRWRFDSAIRRRASLWRPEKHPSHSVIAESCDCHGTGMIVTDCRGIGTDPTAGPGVTAPFLLIFVVKKLHFRFRTFVEK